VNILFTPAFLCDKEKSVVIAVLLMSRKKMALLPYYIKTMKDYCVCMREAQFVMRTYRELLDYKNKARGEFVLYSIRKRAG